MTEDFYCDEVLSGRPGFKTPALARQFWFEVATKSTKGKSSLLCLLCFLWRTRRKTISPSGCELALRAQLQWQSLLSSLLQVVVTRPSYRAIRSTVLAPTLWCD